MQIFSIPTPFNPHSGQIASLNRAHPLAPDIGFWRGGYPRAVNLVTLALPASVSQTIGFSTPGKVSNFDGVAQSVETGITANPSSLTLLALVRGTAAPSAAGTAQLAWRDQYSLGWNHDNASYRGAASLHIGATYPVATFGPLLAGVWYVLGLTWDGTTLRAYKNGVETDNAPAAGALNTGVSDNFRLARSSGTSYLACSIGWTYLSSKALPAADVKSLSDNISQLIEASAETTFFSAGGPIIITSSDSLITAVGDTSASTLLSSLADSLSCSITDVAASISVVLSAADSVAAAISEASAAQVRVAVADAIAVAIADIASCYGTVTAADGLNLSSAEAVQLLCALAASDSVSMSTAEGLATIASVIQVSDALGVSISDAATAVLARLMRSDTLGMSVTEIVALLSALSRSDAVTLSVADQSQLAVLLATLDTLSISVTDEAMRQAIGVIIARLTARLRMYPTLSGQTKVNDEH